MERQNKLNPWNFIKSEVKVEGYMLPDFITINL